VILSWVLVAAFGVLNAFQVPRQYDAAVFENEFLRVHVVTLNTVGHFRANAGVPQVIYCLGALSAIRDDGSTEPCARDQAIFVSSGALDLRADGDARPEVLVAEIKQRPTGFFLARQDDAVKAAADVYHLLLENETVRVMRIALTAGQRTKTHWLAGRDFIYPLTSARTRLTFADGNQLTVEMRARLPRWTADETRYAVENVGATDEVALVIELK
jgi:hypothetical protein